MTHSNALAVLFAFGSALSIAWGTVLRHQIAEQTGTGSDDKGVPIIAAITQLRWWMGLLLAFAGYGLQIVALSFGTLLVVQPVLVLSLMLTLPLSAKLDGRRISKSETSWAALLTCAVGVLVLLGRPLPGLAQPPLHRWLLAIAIGAIIFAGLYALSKRNSRSEKALLLGVITGGIMGYVAVLSKAVVDIFVHHGGLHTLALSWESYGLIGAAIIGVAVQQASFNAGALKNSLPAMTIVEPLFAFTLGYTILGESFQVSGMQWVWMGAALLTMIVSTVILSRKSIT